MTCAILISGLGEPASGENNGMRALAERLDNSGFVVAMLTWRQVAEAVTLAGMGDSVALIGHSFGGDAAVEAAERLDAPCRLVAVDPVPRSLVARWTASSIRVPPTVTRALCIRRGYGLYPLAKKLSGHGVENVTIAHTDHDSVMRSFRTHAMIEQFVSENS